MDDLSNLPNISAPYLDVPTNEKLDAMKVSTHPPRILLLYGALREKSYSQLLTLEAERILQHFAVLPCVRANDARRVRRESAFALVNRGRELTGS